MHAVVGCAECEALWIVSGRPETSACPRCGDRKAHALRTKFYTAEDAEDAREARARLLADRHDTDESVEAIESFVDLETEVAAIDDETYLAAAGVDPDTVAAAGDRATEATGGHSRRDIVRDAVRSLDQPDADEIRTYATARGLDEDAVEQTLTQLVQAGAVTHSEGTYRLL